MFRITPGIQNMHQFCDEKEEKCEVNFTHNVKPQQNQIELILILLSHRKKIYIIYRNKVDLYKSINIDNKFLSRFNYW